MSRVSFRAWRGKHYVGLPEVLAALGRITADAVWELSLDDVSPGPQGDDLTALAGGPRVGTRQLLLAAFPDGQIIDGALRAYAGAADPAPFLTLFAVDSSEWDVESADAGILSAVREAFSTATDAG